jgi:hypothetical protein
VAGVWVWVIVGVITTIVRAEQAMHAVVARLQRLETLNEVLHESTDRIVDLSRMSDAAKSLLFRQSEIEAMNELLHEYVMRQDYAKAEDLIGDVEKRLGYADQVQAMRDEIVKARSSTMEQKIDSAVDRISRLLEAQAWDQAARQVNRLVALVPKNPKIAVLPELVADARAKHKRALLEGYGEAVKSGDIDRSIELLHQLDADLTPQEAAALQDSARGVFRAKLHNLGVQFAIRVTDKQWQEAAAIGEQIVGEFPNTRMAQEVRQKMETLQQLAQQQRQQPQPGA